MVQPTTSPVNLPTTSSAFRALAGLGGFGLLCIAVYSLRAAGFVGFAESAVVGLMTAVAAASVGGLLGFLFGIPRRHQGGDSPEAVQDANDGTSNSAYRPNTNLEQISDWLTKILVGVGLTQIPEISDWFARMSSMAAAGLGGSDASRVVASTMIVFFSVCGFLFGFLWTRLYLPRAFVEADLGLLTQELDRTTAEMRDVKDAFDRQPKLDAVALSLVQRQLNPSLDSVEVPQKELDEAIASASLPVKVQIFYQAQDVRSSTWREAETKPRMEKTIPIFRALIASDVEKKFHKNHGQLGFALKDMRHPDWTGAEAELTRAIEMRGSGDKEGWLFYEFCRAECRIHLDPDFGERRASSDIVRNAVLSDLRAAATEYLRPIVLAQPVIVEWLRLNEVQI